MKVAIEEVSPAMARDWLAKSKGNRALNENYVLSLAVAMSEGKWLPDASEVVFDTDEALIDGHHRLSAVVLHEKPVKMAVKRGVQTAARNVIDTGRTRSMSDLLGMYRSVDYANHRRAALNICVFLLVGVGKDASKMPSIRTLDAFDSWMRHFKDGIDWAVTATRSSGVASINANAFTRGPVLGAFAFAHRFNPDGVSKFHRSAIMGENLRAGDPALTLRNFVLGTDRGRNGMAATGRRDIAFKTLSAIHADLSGVQMAKLMVNSHALPFFRSAYKGRTVDKLVEPWKVVESAATTDGAQ